MNSKEMKKIMDCGNEKEYIGNLTICRKRCEICFLGAGRSVVYRAKYNRGITDQVIDVAAKEVTLDRKSSTKKNFEKEVGILKLANGHKNILQYFSTEQRPSSVNRYIVTEYCDGNLEDLIIGTFKQEYSNYKKFTIISDITSGLVHLHEKEVIHRDLKPENILFKRVSHSEIVMKLADFGISRQGDASRTEITLTNDQGTKCWQAPEMCGPDFVEHIQGVGSKLDLFPLGLIIVYTLLDGEYAFGSNAEQYNKRLRKEKPEMLQNIEALLRSRYDGICALVEKMFSKDPRQRPSAIDVLEQVDSCKMVADLTPDHFNQHTSNINDVTLVPVKDLNLSYSGSNSWFIKVRVTRKSKILSVKNVKRLEMDLLDGSGRISAVAFGPQAFELNSLMKEESIYTVRQVTIKKAFRSSSEVPHPCEIRFECCTKIEEKQEETDFPSINFTSLSYVQSCEEKYVDIEAYVELEGRLENYNPRTHGHSEENIKKVLTLVDHTNLRTNFAKPTPMCLTVYGSDAYTSFANKRVKLTSVKIEKTNGKKSLKTTKRSQLEVLSQHALACDDDNKENIY